MTTSTTPTPDARTSWRALLALCVGLFLTLMDQSFVAVSLPRIREDFDASINEVFWVSAAYLLTFAVPLLVTGRLGDRYGQRRMYLIGMAVFTVGALACALAPSITWLIVFRALQGFGGSLINPQPLAIINRIFPYHRRGSAMGVWSAVAGSAGLFGPVLGGVIVGYFDWRWIFALYVPIGILSLIAVAAFVPNLTNSASAIDALSGLFSLLAVFGIVFALQQGPEIGWDVLVWSILITGVVVLIAFIDRQRRMGDKALMPLELFRHRNFSYGAVSVFALGFAVYPIQLPIMLYLQVQVGLEPEVAALLLVPMGVLSVVLAPVAGRLTDVLKPGVLSKTGYASLIAAMVMFAVFMGNDFGMWWMLLPISALGAANAFVWSPNSTISMRALPGGLSGAGSGVYNTSRQVGAVIGAAAVGAVMQMLEPLGIGVAAGTAMLLPVALLIVGFLAVSNFRPDERP